MCIAVLLSVNMAVTKKGFNFAEKFNMPLFFVSASDGTNVVKVSGGGVGGGDGLRVVFPFVRYMGYSRVLEMVV